MNRSLVFTLSMLGVLTACRLLWANDIDSQQVAAWVASLDAGEFEVREHASQRLIKAGAVSIRPVEAAITRGNLEVVARGLSILRQLSQELPGDVTDLPAAGERRELAGQALMRLARSRSRLIATQAAESRVVVAATDEEIAMRSLRVLGAQVVEGSEFDTNLPLALELNRNWRGTKQDMRHLLKLPRLVSLSIKRARISDAEIAYLSEIRSLQSVDLMYVNVSDASIQHLQDLPNLQSVRLYGTRITAQRALQLDRSIASRKGARRPFNRDFVDYKQGAFLGVLCQPAPTPCIIRDVTPDSAADDADLLPGDVIYRYDDKPVRHFDDLRALIGENRAGDSKKIRVLRLGELLQKSQKLAIDDTLGVESTTSPIGVRVTKVVDGGVAATIGLRAGDIITAYNGEEVPDQRELVALFQAQLNAVRRRAEGAPAERPDPFGIGGNAVFSDSCTLSFVREFEELEKTVTFGEWE